MTVWHIVAAVVLLQGALSASLTVFPPVSRGVGVGVLGGLSELPSPETLPDNERTRTLDCWASDSLRFGLPVGLSGVASFEHWVNASVGGVACEEVRGVDGWEPDGGGSVGMVCEGVGEGSSGAIVDVAVWVKEGGKVVSYSAENLVRYDVLSDPFVDAVGEVGGSHFGAEANDKFGAAVSRFGNFIAIGAAFDDSVEVNGGAVYVMRVESNGSLALVSKIASEVNGGPVLAAGDKFGSAVAEIGDWNGDGVVDIAVGAQGSGGGDEGAVYVMSMTSNGTHVISMNKIAGDTRSIPDSLPSNAEFGSAIAWLGDINGDGLASDIAIGAPGYDGGGGAYGAVYICFLNEEGVGNGCSVISNFIGGGPTDLKTGDKFGAALSSGVDVDGDGVNDLLVSATAHDDGAVYALFMDTEGEGKGSAMFTDEIGVASLGTTETFGSALVFVGDLNGDGVFFDHFVGASGDATGGKSAGAGFMMVLDDEGDAEEVLKVASGLRGIKGSTISEEDRFGASGCMLGNLNKNGQTLFLAVGAPSAKSNGVDAGVVHILQLNDQTDASTPPTILGASHPLPSISAISTTTTPLLPPSPLPHSLPHLSPHANDPNRHILPIAILTSTFNASSLTIRVWNVTVDGRLCDDAEVIDGWPGGSGSTRRVGIACVGVPEGESGKVSSVEVVYEEVMGGELFRLEREEVVRFDSFLEPLVEDELIVSSEWNGGPTLEDGDNFGRSIAWVGDITGDGLGDIVVGANGVNEKKSNTGGLFLFSLPSQESSNDDGVTLISRIVTNTSVDGPQLPKTSNFGVAVAWIGDLTGNGLKNNIVVGANGDDTESDDTGAVYVLTLLSDGNATVISKIAADTLLGAYTLSYQDNFGISLCWLSEIGGNGGGVYVAVGANGDDEGGSNRGALYIIAITSEGIGKATIKIASNMNGGPTLRDDSYFGSSIAHLGDLKGEGTSLEVAVGAPYEDLGGSDAGAVYILSFSETGAVIGCTQLGSLVGGGPELADSTLWGSSLTSLGTTWWNDGKVRLAVGGIGGGVENRGLVQILSLTSNGTATLEATLTSNVRGLSALDNEDHFGYSIAFVEGVYGDGSGGKLVVGAATSDIGGTDRGAIHVLQLNDQTDASTPPTILGASHPLPSISAISTTTTPLLPPSPLPHSLPHLSPHANDPNRHILPIAILTSTFNASSLTIRVWNVTVDGRLCDDAEVIDGWPGGSGSTRRVGIACVGVPEGESGKVSSVEVVYEEVMGGELFRLEREEVVRYEYAGMILAVSTPFPDQSNTVQNEFGRSIAVLNSTFVAVGGGESSVGSERGSVTLFRLDDTGLWTEVSHIESDNPIELLDGDHFGRAVAFAPFPQYQDADFPLHLLLVGAHKRLSFGSVEVFAMDDQGEVTHLYAISSGQGGAPTFSAPSQFGKAITTLGDLSPTGGGLVNVAIMDPSYDNFRGLLRIFSVGTQQAFLLASIDNRDANGNLLGSFSSMQVASTIFEADGEPSTAEIVIGIPNADFEGQNRGLVAVVSINRHTYDTTLFASYIPSRNGIPPVQDNGKFGLCVMVLGDSNGNGKDEVLVSGVHNLFVVEIGEDGTLDFLTRFLAGEDEVLSSTSDRFGLGLASLSPSEILIGSPLDNKVFLLELDLTDATTPQSIQPLQPPRTRKASPFSPNYPSSHLLFQLITSTPSAQTKAASVEIFIGERKCRESILISPLPSSRASTRALDVDCIGIPEGIGGETADVKVEVMWIGGSSETVVGEKVLQYASTAGIPSQLEDEETPLVAGHGIGGLELAADVGFGQSIAFLGDINLDGVATDILVGSAGDDSSGSISILSVIDNQVVMHKKWSRSSTSLSGIISSGDNFGYDVAAVGRDLFDDGTYLIIVGSRGEGEQITGAVNFLPITPSTMEIDATRIVTLDESTQALIPSSQFGSCVSVLPEGVGDDEGERIAVIGAIGLMSLYVKSLSSPNGILLEVTDLAHIAKGVKGGPTDISIDDVFGFGCEAIGDGDGDGVENEVAVSAILQDTSYGIDAGAVYIMSISPTTGESTRTIKLASGVLNMPHLAVGGHFGASIAAMGRKDGLVEFLVGQDIANEGGASSGAVWQLGLNVSTGNISYARTWSKVTTNQLDIPTNTQCGIGSAFAGDFSRDGVGGIVVGCVGDVVNGVKSGSVHWIRMRDPASNPLSPPSLESSNGFFLSKSLPTSPSQYPTLSPYGTIAPSTLEFTALTSKFNISSTLYSLPPTSINASVRKQPCIDVRVTPLATASARRVRVECTGVFEGGSGEIAEGKVMIGDDVMIGNVVEFDDLKVPLVQSSSKVSSLADVGIDLQPSAKFGRSCVDVGDWDGDGVGDIAVGTHTYNVGSKLNVGIVYLLFLNSDGSLKDGIEVPSSYNLGLEEEAKFGVSLSWIGTHEIAVGASNQDDTGAVFLLALNASGSIQSATKINGTTIPILDPSDLFGYSVAHLEGIAPGNRTIAVGAVGYDSASASSSGAVIIITFDASHIVLDFFPISAANGGGPSLSPVAFFGSAIAPIGDLDQDGVVDLAVGSNGWSNFDGSVFILFMREDITVNSTVEIEGHLGGENLEGNFGVSVAWIGDWDGNGIASDIAVGEFLGGDLALGLGGVWFLSLSRSGEILASLYLSSTTPQISPLPSSSLLGISVATRWVDHGILIGAHSENNFGTVRLITLPHTSSATTPPTVFGTFSPLPSNSNLHSSTPSSKVIPPSSSNFILPHLDPLGLDPSLQVLPLALLTGTFNASYSQILLHNISVGTEMCASTDFLPHAWLDIPNTRAIGVACVGIPAGRSGTVETVTVWYESEVEGVKGVKGERAVVYGMCKFDTAIKVTRISTTTPTLSPLGGTRVVVEGEFTNWNLSSFADASSDLAQRCSWSLQSLGMISVAPQDGSLLPADVDAAKVAFWIWIGGRACDQVMWLNTTHVECYAPAGLGTSLDVVIGVMGNFFLSPITLDYGTDVGVVEWVESVEVDQMGEDIVALNGSFTPFIPHIFTPTRIRFGPFYRTFPNPGGMKFRSFQTPAGVGANLNVSLCIIDLHSPLPSNLPRVEMIQASQVLCTEEHGAATISYQPPSLTTVQPNAELDPLGGNTLVLTGSDFGDPLLLAPLSILPMVTLSDRACYSVVHVSATEIRCTTPILSGSSARVVVTVLGASSQEEVPVGINTVSLVAVTPRRVMPAEEGLRTITFSATVFGARDVVRLVLGGVECPKINVLSEESLECRNLPVPSLWTTDEGEIYVASSQNSISQRPVLRVEPPPSILSVNAPLGTPTAGGVSVEVVGLGFGLIETDFDAVVFGGDSSSAVLEAWEEVKGGESGGVVATSSDIVVITRTSTKASLTSPSTSVSSILPPGVGRNVPVRLVTSWKLISNAFSLSYTPPSLTSLTLVNSTTTPTSPTTSLALLLPGLEGVSFDVCGANLAPRGRDLDQIIVGGVKCMEMQALSTECARCLSLRTPRANGSTLSDWEDEAVVVIVGGQTSGPTLGLAQFVPPPLLSQVTPDTSATGASVTLIGEGMGETAGYVVGVVVGGGVFGNVATENESVLVTDVSYVSSTRISFTLPSGVGTSIPVRFLTATNLSSNSLTLSYSPPTITSINPTKLLPGEESIDIEVCGENFATRADDLDGIWIGGIACASVGVSVENQCAQCFGLKTPGAPGSPHASWPLDEERIIVGGRAAISNILTYVPPPTIISIAPNPAGPGSLLTINGEGFGTEASDLSRIFVANVACSVQSWLSPSRVQCRIPSVHPVWEEAERNSSVIVPFVRVAVELSSGMQSIGIDDADKLVPAGENIRVRPKPVQPPLGVVAWRPIGQSGTLLVRWRFPGPALEALRIESRVEGDLKEAIVSRFRIQVASSKKFDEVDEDEDEDDPAFGASAVDRDVSIQRFAPVSTDPSDAAAWEWHEARVSALLPTTLYVRIRAENSDGSTAWVQALDPNTRPGMKLMDSSRIPDTCQDSEYLSTQHETNIKCVPCPEGAVCGGLGAENVTGAAGWWRVPWSRDALGFAECPLPSACLGYSGRLQSTPTLLSPTSNSSSSTSSSSSTPAATTVPVEEQWRLEDVEDRPAAFPSLVLVPSAHEACAPGHRGVLCSSCAVSYFPGVGGICSACGDRGWVATRFLLISIAILVFFSYFLHRAWNTRMVSSSVAVMVMKIVFSSLQTTAIVGAVRLQWPTAAREFFDVVDAGSSFTTSGLAIECLLGESSTSPFLRTLAIVSMPFFVILFVMVFWWVYALVEERGGCTSRDERQQGLKTTGPQDTRRARFLPIRRRPPILHTWKERMILSTVVLIFLVHTPLSSAALRLLTCTPVGTSGSSDEEKQLRLLMDLDVNCEDSENLAAMLGISIPVLVFISLGVPIGSALLLRHIGVDNFSDPIWRGRVGFLVNGYREKFYYWESVVLLRKVFLAFTTTTLSPAGGGMQITMALLVLLLAMGLHARAQPFQSKVINVLEGMGLLVGAVTMVAGQFVLLESVDAAGTATGIIGPAASVLIITINTFFFLVALVILSKRGRAAISNFIQSSAEAIQTSITRSARLNQSRGTPTTSPKPARTTLPTKPPSSPSPSPTSTSTSSGIAMVENPLRMKKR